MSFPSQGYVPTTPIEVVLKDSVINLARLADEEWFASDFVPTPADGRASEVIIQFCYSVKATFEISLDGGATWCALNNKFKPESETINQFIILGINTQAFNFRADSAGTLRYAYIFERGGET